MSLKSPAYHPSPVTVPLSGTHRCPRQAQGFTLIEVLIAITLLGVMVVVLFASLRVSQESWEKGEKKMAEVNEMAVVYNFFQQHLSQAIPVSNDLTKDQEEEGEEAKFSFQGEKQIMQFVSSFPASVGQLGLQLFTLNMQGEEGNKELTVTLTPFLPVDEGEELGREEVTLLEHVQDFKLSYFGSEDDQTEGTWEDEWLDKQWHPKLVKISIKTDKAAYWPDMVFELKVPGTASDSDDGDDDENDLLNDPGDPGDPGDEN